MVETHCEALTVVVCVQKRHRVRRDGKGGGHGAFFRGGRLTLCLVRGRKLAHQQARGDVQQRKHDCDRGVAVEAQHWLQQRQDQRRLR